MQVGDGSVEHASPTFYKGTIKTEDIIWAASHLQKSLRMIFLGWEEKDQPNKFVLFL